MLREVHELLTALRDSDLYARTTVLERVSDSDSGGETTAQRQEKHSHSILCNSFYRLTLVCRGSSMSSIDQNIRIFVPSNCNRVYCNTCPPYLLASFIIQSSYPFPASSPTTNEPLEVRIRVHPQTLSASIPIQDLPHHNTPISPTPAPTAATAHAFPTSLAAVALAAPPTTTVLVNPVLPVKLPRPTSPIPGCAACVTYAGK